MENQINYAGHEETKSILGVGWGPFSLRDPLNPPCFCIQSSRSWNQCCKFYLLQYIFRLHQLSQSQTLVFFFPFKSQIGKLEEGLNPPSWNMLHFHGTYLGLVIKTGLVTGIISLTVSIFAIFTLNFVIFILNLIQWNCEINRKESQSEGLLLH